MIYDGLLDYSIKPAFQFWLLRRILHSIVNQLYTNKIFLKKEYYSAIKKNKIIPFAVTWMDLEIVILSEVNQKEKDKYRMISLIYGI